MTDIAISNSAGASLHDAFRSFAETSGRLETAYAQLESEVIALRSALAAATGDRTAEWQEPAGTHGTGDPHAAQLDQVIARHQRLAALGEMAATLAHQIRTPLSAALLYATNAMTPALAPMRRNEMLTRAVDCLHDLEQLVGDMLGFARGAAATALPVDVDALVGATRASAIALVRPGQQLVVEHEAAGAIVRGNREALQGALLNLITNALQSAGSDAHVAVRVIRTASSLEISVADNGPGVPRNFRTRIFDPFFTSRPDGTGLGLAVVRSVAEAHGGDVEVLDSAGPGATFVLRLPLTAVATRNPECQAA